MFVNYTTDLVDFVFSVLFIKFLFVRVKFSATSVSVVNYGTSLAGEGDSVTGAVTLRLASDLLKVGGSFLRSSFIAPKTSN